MSKIAKFSRRVVSGFCSFLLTVSVMGAESIDSGFIDQVDFGDEHSEKAHSVVVHQGSVIEGAWGETARQLLPGGEVEWLGGDLTFLVKIDPELVNYVTVKFWGSDHAPVESRLMLFIDDKQVGQRHLGEVDMLDIMDHAPRYLDRFYYKTLPLPLNMTEGKTNVELKIQSQGRIWGYAPNAEAYQKEIKDLSRGIYRAYIHTDPFFSPSEGDLQAEAPGAYPVRVSPGPEIFSVLKEKVNTEIVSQLASEEALEQEAVLLLAQAYHEEWTIAYQNNEVVEKVVGELDGFARRFLEDPSLAEKGWHGLGKLGHAVLYLGEELEPYVKKRVSGTSEKRKVVWVEMLVASRDSHSMARRKYTNQSMIVDLNTYYCNRGIALIDSKAAWDESKAMRLLYESVGLEPWSGSWDEKGEPSWSAGKDFIQLSEKGLTKELGYVGGYGEIVVDLVLSMYEASRPSLGEDGDLLLLERLLKITKARAPFRYPLPDADGYRAMQLEAIVGWRDWHYPGGVIYDQMPGREGGPLDAAAATLDPVLVGYAQQMIEDNQFFATLENRIGASKGSRIGVIRCLIPVPRNYELIMEQEASTHRLPMTPGQPDFVFYDVEDGVVALKNGDDILYASLYWRSRYSVNSLARVHFMTPNKELDSTIFQEVRFNDSGLSYTIPDYSSEPFNKRYEHFYKDAGMYLAVAGTEQPVAQVPVEMKGYEVGRENIFAGKGDFYVMEFGPYLVAMNCTKDEIFEFDLPEGFGGAKDLVSGEIVSGTSLEAKPWQTMVLYSEGLK